MNLNVSKINVNDIVLVYGEKVPKHFCRIAIVAGILPTDFSSESRGTIVKIMQTNTIFVYLINKLFTIENTYHDTNQTDKEREQKLRQEAALLRKLRY